MSHEITACRARSGSWWKAQGAGPTGGWEKQDLPPHSTAVEEEEKEGGGEEEEEEGSRAEAMDFMSKLHCSYSWLSLTWPEAKNSSGQGESSVLGL